MTPVLRNVPGWAPAKAVLDWVTPGEKSCFFLGGSKWVQKANSPKRQVHMGPRQDWDVGKDGV